MSKSNSSSKPKRARSAYIFFGKDERENIKAEFPDMKSTEIISEVAKRWKTLKEDDPSAYDHYTELAKEDKVRYNQDIDGYVPKEGEKKIKKKKDSKKPKRGRSAWILYGQDERKTIKEEFPDMKQKEVLTEISKRWKSLSDKEKEKYNELAKKDTERYNNDMKTYSIGKDEVPTTAYQAFCKENRLGIMNGNPDLVSKQDVTKELRKMWNKLNVDEKKDWKGKLGGDKDRAD